MVLLKIEGWWTEGAFERWRRRGGREMEEGRDI
jgi:hypothetical protein